MKKKASESMKSTKSLSSKSMSKYEVPPPEDEYYYYYDEEEED
jgi:hypothetical protein